MTKKLNYRLISFDLQGTLSDSAFSDEFWLELLPLLYAQKSRLTLDQAQSALRSLFGSLGKYHRFYYCPRSWIEELCPERSFAQVLQEGKHSPHLFEDSLALVKELVGLVPLIIVSTTTHDFIELELSDARQYFEGVYSTLDDFDTAGKRPEIFRAIASTYGLPGKRSCTLATVRKWMSQTPRPPTGTRSSSIRRARVLS